MFWFFFCGVRCVYPQIPSLGTYPISDRKMNGQAPPCTGVLSARVYDLELLRAVLSARLVRAMRRLPMAKQQLEREARRAWLLLPAHPTIKQPPAPTAAHAQLLATTWSLRWETSADSLHTLAVQVSLQQAVLLPLGDSPMLGPRWTLVGQWDCRSGRVAVRAIGRTPGCVPSPARSLGPPARASRAVDPPMAPAGAGPGPSSQAVERTASPVPRQEDAVASHPAAGGRGPLGGDGIDADPTSVWPTFLAHRGCSSWERALVDNLSCPATAFQDTPEEVPSHRLLTVVHARLRRLWAWFQVVRLGTSRPVPLCLGTFLSPAAILGTARVALWLDYHGHASFSRLWRGIETRAAVCLGVSLQRSGCPDSLAGGLVAWAHCTVGASLRVFLPAAYPVVFTPPDSPLLSVVPGTVTVGVGAPPASPRRAVSGLHVLLFPPTHPMVARARRLEREQSSRLSVDVRLSGEIYVALDLGLVVAWALMFLLRELPLEGPTCWQVHPLVEQQIDRVVSLDASLVPAVLSLSASVVHRLHREGAPLE
jgi:hypothetical protein